MTTVVNSLRYLTVTICLAMSFAASGQVNEKTVPKPPAPKVIGDTDTAFDGEESGGGEVEALYDKHQADESKKRGTSKPKEAARPALKDANTLSELANLAPFSDVAVIQRRFLPRTKRFELSAGGMSSVNNPFFTNLGLNLRGAYYFLEKHGVELQYSLLSNSRVMVTDNLKELRGVQTTNLVTAKSYMGIAYKWIPLFGKITFLNKHIVPFDICFTAGGGLSQTSKKGEPTLHLGTGQTFALTKRFALRWDVTWNLYQATTDSATTPGATESTNHNDLFLGIGASFFFPEATYR